MLGGISQHKVLQRRNIESYVRNDASVSDVLVPKAHMSKIRTSFVGVFHDRFELSDVRNAV